MRAVRRRELAAVLLLIAAISAPSCQRRDEGRRASEVDSEAERERDGLLAESERLRAAGRHAEALERVDAALGKSPSDALLTVERARLLGHLATGRRSPGEAADHFGRCAALEPAAVDCRYGLGLALAELGELDRAAVEIGKAAETLDRADAWAELGKLERRRRRLDAAAAAFSRALGRDRHHLPSLLGLGQMLVATGRAEIGQELLERHREEAAFEDHLKAFQRAAADPEAEAEVLLQLAQMYRQREDPEREEATLREALARAPDSLPVNLALANHLLHRGRASEAERLVGSLDVAMAEHPATLFLRGTVALARGAEEEARGHFSASLTAGDWPPLVYVDAGRAWFAAGSPLEAATAFRRAIEGAPGSAAAHLGLARSQRSLGRPSDALASVNRALELDPSDGTALFLRAVLELELGDAGRARETFAFALASRRLDLLPEGGAEDLRRELGTLEPPPAAMELFAQALERQSASRAGSR